MSTWVSVLGFAAGAVGVCVSLPQVLVLLRSSHADGVSFPSSVLGVLASVTWLAYGLLLLDAAQIVANVPGLAGALMVAVLVMRRRSLPVVPALASSAAWCAAVVGIGVVGGVAGVGLAATAVTVVSRGPQVAQAFRGTSLAALSPFSLALSITASALWTTYGLAVAQLPVWGCSLVMGLLTSLILVRRCPPRQVALAAHHGRWGTPGQTLVRPLVAAHRAHIRVRARWTLAA